jgi:predicted DNA-binding transcriptional regulator AlpA
MKSKIDLSNLQDKLPPMIARDHVEQLLGGVISAKRLANLDSLGEGPKRMRIGKKVVYRTEDLLEWLEQRSKELN